MSQRNLKDASGRKWECKSPVLPALEGVSDRPIGLDVVLTCTSDSVSSPVAVTVGWQWEKMSDNGLGRMITLASPLPRQ